MELELRGIHIPEGYYKPRKTMTVPAWLHGRAQVFIARAGGTTDRPIYSIFTDGSKRFRLYSYYGNDLMKVISIPKDVVEKHRALVYKKEAQKFIRVGSGLLAKLGGASGERAALREVINDIKKVI